MALQQSTSPHLHIPRTTGWVMRHVIYATLPALAVMTWVFGYGTLINCLLAALFALGCEALVLRLRAKPIAFYLRDGSALVTGLLLALAIPPIAPWWLTFIGIFFAIVVAKQLYGGLGMNPFNPAMIGYVVLLIAFPVEMTAWLDPAGQNPDSSAPSLVQSISYILLGADVDAITGATPLDSFKTYAGQPEILSQHPALNTGFDGGWQLVNLSFLLGGFYLLARKIISWHIPVSILLTLLVLSTYFSQALDADSYASVSLHLFCGGTMLGAFFIATDPVSAATSNRGKIFYGIGIGALTFVIRTWGGYPDAIAFSVLLMNLAAPTIDYYTQPRTYGHSRPNKGLAKPD